MALSCAGIFYPYVSADLGVGTGVMSYYTVFIWFSATGFLSFLGKLLYKMDARIILSASVILIALVFIWLSFASSLWQFYLGAFAMGLSVSMLLFLAPSTLINRWFAKRAGFLLGIVMAFTGVGGMVWSAVGGILILQIGWAMTYRVFAFLSALTLLATIFLVVTSPESKGLKPVGNQGGIADIDINERGIPARRAFKMPVFFAIFFMVFLLNFGMYVYFIIPSYIMEMDVSLAIPVLGSLASSCAMAGQTVSKLIFGLAGEKLPYACTIGGIVLGIIGLLALFFAVQAVLLCLAAFLFGVYYGITNVMSPIITRINFGVGEYPKIYSRISTGAAIANMVAALIWGAIIDATGSFTIVFIGVIVLMAATIVLVMLIKRLGVTQSMQANVATSVCNEDSL